MRVDTYLEEPLRFAHDLYHLHIIMAGLCKRPCRTTKAGPTSLSEYLIGLQLRTIQHVPQRLVLFHFLFNLNYINKCMIKSVVKSYASCLRQTDAAVCMCLLHTKSNVPLCSSAVNQAERTGALGGRGSWRSGWGGSCGGGGGAVHSDIRRRKWVMSCNHMEHPNRCQWLIKKGITRSSCSVWAQIVTPA